MYYILHFSLCLCASVVNPLRDLKMEAALQNA